jgi:hypothetical protein
MASSVVCAGCKREFGIIQQAHIDHCHALQQMGIATRAQYKARFGSTMSAAAVAVSVKTITGFNAELTAEERSANAACGYKAAAERHGASEIGRRGGLVGSQGLWSKPGQKDRHRARIRKMNANGSMQQNPNKLERKFWDMIGQDRIEFASFRFWKTILEERGVKHITPDFRVPGTMRMIEVFGDYWHGGENPQDRIDLWRSVGCECLVVWEHEINARDEAMIGRVESFISGTPHECPAPAVDQAG